METRLLLFLSAGHLIGDFPFQPQWLGENKGKSWEINAYHALVYAATVLVVSTIGGFTLPLAIVGFIAISHFLIDPLKARWHIVKHIWLDQIFHIIVLIIVAILVR